LVAIVERIRLAFNRDQVGAVLIPELGLGQLELDDRRKGVFALTALLGDLTANIPLTHVVWDVRNKQTDASGHTSFSESDRKAGYHTDNGALPIPEHFFVLYAVHAAACGGGVTLLRDARRVKRHLQDSPAGQEAVRVLTATNLPRRIPAAFRPYGDVSADGYQYVPVFSDTPFVRWRRGGIRRGLEAHPECETPDVRTALDLLIETLTHGPEEIQTVIPTDGILLINNHIMLHGRTAFTDPDRHLLRLRFHQPGQQATTLETPPNTPNPGSRDRFESTG
jgi:alpha-ketoglutarate-dependent taurine dioxygenase